MNCKLELKKIESQLDKKGKSFYNPGDHVVIFKSPKQLQKFISDVEDAHEAGAFGGDSSRSFPVSYSLIGGWGDAVAVNMFSKSNPEVLDQIMGMAKDISSDVEIRQVTENVELPEFHELPPSGTYIESSLVRKNAMNKLLIEVIAELSKKAQIDEEVIVYDNGGETLDRYTVFIDDAVYGMCDTAKGFNQYLGDTSEVEEGPHLGKKLSEVPKEIEWAVKDRMNKESSKKKAQEDIDWDEIVETAVSRAIDDQNHQYIGFLEERGINYATYDEDLIAWEEDVKNFFDMLGKDEDEDLLELVENDGSILASKKKAQLEEYVVPMMVEEDEETAKMIDTLEDIKTDPQYVQDNQGYWHLLEQYEEGDPIWTKISEYQNLPLDFIDQFNDKIDFDLLLNTNKEFAYDGTTVEDFFNKGYIDAHTVVNDHPDVAEFMLAEEQDEDYVDEMVEDMPLLDSIIDEVVVVDDLEDVGEVIEDMEEVIEE